MSDILIKFPDRNQFHNQRELVEQLSKILNGRVQEAWLFGSAARGDFNRHSDVDLILVLETDLPFHERIHQFSDLLKLGHEMDILIYTPEEFEIQKKRAPENGFWKRVVEQMIRVV